MTDDQTTTPEPDANPETPTADAGIRPHLAARFTIAATFLRSTPTPTTLRAFVRPVTEQNPLPIDLQNDLMALALDFADHLVIFANVLDGLSVLPFPPYPTAEELARAFDQLGPMLQQRLREATDAHIDATAVCERIAMHTAEHAQTC